MRGAELFRMISGCSAVPQAFQSIGIALPRTGLHRSRSRATSRNSETECMLGRKDENLSIALRNARIQLAPPTEAIDPEYPTVDETLVEGIVQLELTRSKSISSVGVGLVCSATGRIRRPLYQRYLTESVDEHLAAGSHLFSFSFTLPSNVPCTSRGIHGAVQWEIKARINHSRDSRFTETTTPLIVEHRRTSAVDYRRHLHRIAGAIDDLGPYRFSVDMDTYVGGTYSAQFTLPSSSHGIEILSIYAYIEQEHTLDRSGDEQNKADVERLTSKFHLFHHSASHRPRDLKWPVPSPEGCEYTFSGQLPVCRPSYMHPIEPTTPAHCHTPINVAHEIIVGMEFRTAPNEPRFRLQGSRPISIASCELGDAATLPLYVEHAPLVEAPRVHSCACTREVLSPVVHQTLAGQTMSDLDRLPHEVLLAIQAQLDGKERDPLLSETWSLENALDSLIDSEDLLADGIDMVQLQLRAQIQELRGELAQHKAALAKAEQDAAKMAEIQELMGDLLTHVHHLRSGATESEVVVREITRDIRSLDTAKRNIVASVTGVKRFQMLVNAYDQLTSLAKDKRYREMANALQAVRELVGFFKSYNAVERIAKLMVDIKELQNGIREQVTNEIETTCAVIASLEQELGSSILHRLVSETMPRHQRQAILTDACLVIDALGDDARSSLIDWYCSRELREYRRIFRPTDEAGQLDNLSRRFAWFRRVLKTHDDDRASVFPQHWHVAGYLVGTFAAITLDNLKVVLSRASSSLSVSTLLESLQVTVDFEREVIRRFGQGYEARVVGLPTAGQARSMSSAFEPYLSVFVEAQDRAISEMVQSYRKPLPTIPGGADGGRNAPSVLPSSTDLFYFYRETLERCAKLSTKQPFLDLCAVYRKWLRVYAEDVLAKALLPISTGRRTSSSEARVNSQDLANACLVLNTADYCSETIVQLEERLRERIHLDLKKKVTLEAEKDLFIGIIANALSALLRELEFAIEPALNGMSRSPWQNQEFVSTESVYVGDLITSVNGVVSSIKGHVEQRKYIRSLADRVVALVISKLTATLVRTRPISQIGAEQILLDLQTLKRCLSRLPATAGEDTVPTTYTRSVTRQIGKLDTILKGIMAPEDPAEDFVRNYLIIIPCQSFSDFQKMLDLKGVRRTDQNALLDVFLARTSVMTDLSDTSVLTSLDMNPSSAYQSTNMSAYGSANTSQPGSTTPGGVLSGISSPFSSLPVSREGSRIGTPFEPIAPGGGSAGQTDKQQFDLRRFGQGIRAGVRMFAQQREGMGGYAS